MKQKKGRKLLGVLLALVMVLGLLPGMSLTAYAAEKSESFTTNKRQRTYTGEYFTITCTNAGDGDGFYLNETNSATISAKNGEIITKVEFTKGAYSIDMLQSATGTVTYNGDVATVSGVKATSLTVNAVDHLQINAVTVYYTIAHTHSFSYTADGATITATCTADGCDLPESSEGAGDHVATLTIAASGGTYDGTTAYGATVTDPNGIQGEAKVQYQKKTGESYGTALETAPTDAGTYKASIRLGEATASVEYSIAQADPTAPTGLTATYGQTLADVTLPNGWTWADSTQSVGNVVDPAATFKANFAGDDNHNAASDMDVTVTVGKAENPATVSETAQVLSGYEKIDLADYVTLNGTTGTVSYETNDEENVYELEDSILTSGEPKENVTVDVKVKIAEDANYKALEKTIKVTIISIPVTGITVEPAKDTMLIGDDLVLRVNYTPGNATDKYYETGGYDESIVDVDGAGIVYAKAAGTTTITVTATNGTDDKSDDCTATCEITVNKLDSKVTKAPEAKGLTYSGQAQELVVAGEATGGKLHYAVTTENKAPAESLYTTSIPTKTDAGTYYVWYKAVGDINHNDSKPASVKATIEKAAPSITAPTARTLTYTGSAQALVTAGTATGGTMQYAVGDADGATGPYTTSIPSKTDAGTYYVWYKAVGDANHTDSKPGVVQVTIKAAPEPTKAPTPDPTKAPTPDPTVAPTPSKSTPYVLAKQKKVTKNSITFTWNRPKGADKFVVYGSPCGKKYTPEKLKTVKGTSYKYTNLKPGTYYKIKVVAYSGGKKIATSNMLHIATKGGSRANPESVSVKKTSVGLSVGGTSKIKATMNSSGKVNVHQKIKYLSTNKSVATVNDSGVITGKSKGKCTVYAYAQNGKYKKIKVTVS